jgi:alpha-ribazole phosphatase/probable phosphoglycerate mutase
MLTTVDLIRHGEPVGGRRYRGQIDDPLSEKGWHQMREAVGAHKPWQHIVSSPLSRCHAFAAELAAQRGLPLSTDARLMEVQFGEWEGKTADELKAQDPTIISRFRRDPIGERPAGAEALEDFAARVAAAWQDLVAHHQGKHVLVVCHAGVIRMVFAHVLGVPLPSTYRIDVPSAGITRVTIEGAGPDAVTQLRFHAGRL